MSRDEREWILRWDHRQKRHYIDGPTHGEIEGVTVVPKSRLEAAEAERDRLREALEKIAGHRPYTASAAPDETCQEIASEALSGPVDE